MSEIDYGMMGVDWEERVDFPRLRQTRLGKARAVALLKQKTKG